MNGLPPGAENDPFAPYNQPVYDWCFRCNKRFLCDDLNYEVAPDEPFCEECYQEWLSEQKYDEYKGIAGEHLNDELEDDLEEED